MNVDVNFVISKLRRYVDAYRIGTAPLTRALFGETKRAIDEDLRTGKKPNDFLLEMELNTRRPLDAAFIDGYLIQWALYKEFQSGSRDGIPTIDHKKVITVLNLLEKEGISEEAQKLLLALLQEEFSNLVVENKTIDKDDGSIEPVPSVDFSTEEIRNHMNRLEKLETEIPELVEKINPSALCQVKVSKFTRFPV